MIKRTGLMILMATFTLFAGLNAFAQDDALPADVAAPEPTATTSTFLDVVRGGGPLGVVLWFAIFATSIAGIALIIDAFITVRATKIMPPTLVGNVQASMEQGDVMKALQYCEEEPSAVANVLSAGFSNVEEGFDTIQDAVGVAAAMEEERLMQRVNYLNVVGNLAPMLGLLGTVQGMIAAFATLAQQGASAGNLLALSISQALYTTAFGLFIAIPSLAFFYYFRNRASTIILTMERLTMDEIKILRNVEVVEE